MSFRCIFHRCCLYCKLFIGVYAYVCIQCIYTVVMIIILYHVDMLLVSSITILCNHNTTLKSPLLNSGAFDGGPPMSHVDFKKCQCRMSLSPMPHVTVIFSSCRMSLSPMSHVELKKWPCRPVDFRGQGHKLVTTSK